MYRAGRLRRPSGELAPTITSSPPMKAFRVVLLPPSRDRKGTTRLRRTGVCSIRGSIRVGVLRRIISVDGMTSMMLAGTWWMA